MFFRYWTIYSTDKNENGRTPFMLFIRTSTGIKKYPGELLDSEEDHKTILEMEKNTEQIKRISNQKQLKSEYFTTGIVLC